ncbi:MAG TPA: PH domain-containing protein [Tepidisphaeraceae bacterium]|jgi:hypothetical protein|nr:PH domain-containing protein [Tepidisphaeraceae bacterium]
MRTQPLAINRVAAAARPTPADLAEADCRASELRAASGSAVAPARSSMATLLSSHILNDGELVLLVLRPSLWFILLSSLRFSAAVLIAVIGMKLWGRAISDRVYIDIAAVAIVGRLMYAIVAWMGRLYVLTDMRILRLSGVFTVDVFDCPLRKVARTRLSFPIRERLLRLGSIEIVPADGEMPATVWSMIARPVEVHETVTAAISRAKQNGFGTR